MDELFTSSRLEVLVPEQRVHLDALDTGSPRWWSNLSTMPQRKQAFFGEHVLKWMLCTIRQLKHKVLWNRRKIVPLDVREATQ
jgi:hypothetical protein